MKALFPIKKEYVKKIFDGSKAYEYRKSFCSLEVDTIVIYESRGKGLVVGEFEKFKRGILKVKDYLFTFLSNPSVPYDNNASERGVRKIKIKQKVSGCFRTDSGADDFAKLHSIAETAMKNGNSKFNAILAVVQQ